jgi:hypothetical protein
VLDFLLLITFSVSLAPVDPGRFHFWTHRVFSACRGSTESRGLRIPRAHRVAASGIFTRFLAALENEPAFHRRFLTAQLTWPAPSAAPRTGGIEDEPAAKGLTPLVR